MKFSLQFACHLIALTLLTTAAKSQDCNTHIRVVTQQDSRMYSTFNHLFNDRYGNQFTMTAVTVDSAVALIFNFGDNQICVDDSARVLINFTDGTEFNAKNDVGKNCNGRSAVYFSRSSNNMDQLESFSTKTIASAKVWAEGNSSQHIRLQNPDLALRIKSSIGCLIEVIGKPLPPLPPTFESDSNSVFVVVENQPEFEGGHDAMADYLQKNLKDKKKLKGKGRVYTSFVVEKDGSIGDVKILRGINEDTDREAIRIISGMPKWKPGKQNGKTVRVRYILPLKF
jgi:hypothetical protein